MDWFVNSTISAEMAQNPSVMTAAGWRQDPKTGKMQQKTSKSKTDRRIYRWYNKKLLWVKK